jgi:hypothetical protein
MSRRMRWAGKVAQMEVMRNTYRLLVGKSEGKTPLGRPRYRWMDNIKMNLGEIEWDGVDWNALAQDRDKWRESSCECGSESLGSIKCWETTEWLHNW